MKQSGIDWIGEIPDDWKINQLSQIVSQVKNKNTGLKETNLLSLSYGKIKRKDINTNDGLLPASFDGYNIIGDGDIVLRLTDLQNDHTSLRVGRATEQGIITSAYTTLHPVDYDNSKYLYYILHSFDLKKGFYGMGSGVRQGLNFDEVKTLKVPLPSKATQQRIAEYLDSKCAQIDSIIEESKKSIEEYKAWKQSVIFEAVTGKNLNCKKKDSGIDTVGLIPIDWKTRRLRFLCDIMTGNQDTQDANPDGKYNFYVRSPNVERSDSYTFEGEGILMAGDGAGAGKVFHHAYGKYAIHQRVYCFYNFRDINTNFFYYYISLLFSIDMEKGSAQSTVPSVRMPMIKDFTFCFPPLHEQESIAKMLDSKCAQIDSLIAEKESLIADLTEYKKSFIFEVVTGKRSV